MTKKTKLVWRLGKLPSVDELCELVKNGIITPKDAKEILFNTETDKDRDKKSLQSEIKFLRDLVEKLSTNRSQIITTIKEIEVPYRKYHWYPYYEVWCGTGTITTATGTGADTCLATSADYTINAGGNSFSDITTF